MSNNPFGITPQFLEFAQVKLDNQNKYLEENQILTQNGQIRTFKDFSFSANLSKRYYAEVTNRTNTIYSLAQDYKLKPVFLTITLNGCFRDALKGDYTRFKSSDKRVLPQLIKRKINNKEALTIRDLIFVLNYQWDIFSSRHCFRNIKKMYIRTFEPHKKDGVPHIHALLYVPSSIIPSALQTYKNIFNAQMNITQNPNRLSQEQIKNGEINGFQWSINNPTGYVMKYIQKTFINFKENDKLDELSAWYVIYKVRRFLTSRSTIPLWVYRKIFFIEKDLHCLTQMLHDENSNIEWDIETNYIRFSSSLLNSELIYSNGIYEYKINNRVIKKKELKQSTQVFDKPCVKQKYNLKPFIPVFQNEQIIGYTRGGKFFQDIKEHVSQKTDMELYNYFINLDLDDKKTNIHHYAHIQNMLCDKGFLFDKVKLDYYDIDKILEDKNDI